MTEKHETKVRLLDGERLVREWVATGHEPAVYILDGVAYVRSGFEDGGADQPIRAINYRSRGKVVEL